MTWAPESAAEMADAKPATPLPTTITSARNDGKLRNATELRASGEASNGGNVERADATYVF